MEDWEHTAQTGLALSSMKPEITHMQQAGETKGEVQEQSTAKYLSTDEEHHVVIH